MSLGLGLLLAEQLVGVLFGVLQEGLGAGPALTPLDAPAHALPERHEFGRDVPLDLLVRLVPPLPLRRLAPALGAPLDEGEFALVARLGRGLLRRGAHGVAGRFVGLLALEPARLPRG
ncbi:MAG TPA: hypothetical protein VFS00_03460 [Polyangiaceae bacterium]|nr:hypothetical protein [Polyangiaceae bacterium]